MPSNDRLASSSRTVVYRDAPHASKLPAFVRFPLLVVLSLSLSGLSHAFLETYFSAYGGMGTITRTPGDSWNEVAAPVVWRCFQLALGWFADYDSYDVAALSLLAHGPHYYLLKSFYNINTTTVVIPLFIDILSASLPFRLLRPISKPHAANTSPESVSVPNKHIVTDYSIQAVTTVLPALIYATTLFTAYSTYLPTYLVTYFSDIPSVQAAHSATPLTLFPLTLILGVAAKSLIFTPSVASKPSLDDAEIASFDPATATLGETFWYNVWGYNTRTKTVIKRTAALALVSGVSTFVQTYNIRGVEAVGALAYSGVWVAAAVVTGSSLGLVAAV